MTQKEFFLAIPKKTWQASIDFQADPLHYQDELSIAFPEGSESIINPSRLDLIWAFNWVLEGSPDNHRWLVLSRDFRTTQKSDLGAVFVQVGIFDDGLLSAEFQYARKKKKHWITKNFWKDFTRNHAGELLLLLLDYLETGHLCEAFSRWQPVVQTIPPEGDQ